MQLVEETQKSAMYYELMMKYEERKQNKTIEMNDEVIGLKQ